MNTNKLMPILCLGLCMPGAAYADVSNQAQILSVPDYAIPNEPICEMMYSVSGTSFSLWAPSADAVEVRIYSAAQGGSPEQTLTMSPELNGIWTAFGQGDLKGKYYTFCVKHDGHWLDETAGIFARAVGINGDRAAIIDMDTTHPEGWYADVRPPMKHPADIVLYEMHHRDFSMHASSGIRNKGKFVALTEEGTVTVDGQVTGISHLKELGITHVHLLPSFDFASIDESKLEDNKYNWGYDPKNYNVPEGSYSTDPSNPATRIKEFKEMVMALHRAGIRVVLDVVYNHIYDAKASAFERTVPDYFFRKKSDGSYCNGSACGNETASNHAMMRKFMIESVCYWANEYHIDGFRFDLMAIHDIETMNAIREALNRIDPSILTYGEGWAVGELGYDAEKLAYKDLAYRMRGIAAFSDNLRDALRGPFSNHKQGAFLIGEKGHEEDIKFGIVGGVLHKQVKARSFWAEEPMQHISYVSCHDDHCLRDRLTNTLGNEASEEELLRLDKLAQTVVLTSQGIPFIFCGEELFRTKQGVGNSYNSDDRINAINWENKTKYADLYHYYKEMIAIRRAHPAFYLGSSDKVRTHLEFFPVQENLVAFQLKDLAGIDEARRIVVLFNSNREAKTVNVPEEDYTILVSEGKADRNGLGHCKGGMIQVAPQSALILMAK